MIEEQLDKATFADEPVKERIIQELAGRPDETLDEAIDILAIAAKSRWSMAARLIRTIGYPRNAKAIPQLVAHVGDLNSPAFQESVQALREMGANIVVPHLINVLLENNPQNEYWLDAVAGICSMLRSTEKTFATQCGAAIAFLLSQKIPEGELDPWYLLIVLEKIGPECATYALPALLQFVRNKGMSELGKQARELIASFDQGELEPYKYVLTDLQ
jgi:hypothetical protein